jgi:hypothetical protein
VFDFSGAAGGNVPSAILKANLSRFLRNQIFQKTRKIKIKGSEKTCRLKCWRQTTPAATHKSR